VNLYGEFAMDIMWKISAFIRVGLFKYIFKPGWFFLMEVAFSTLIYVNAKNKQVCNNFTGTTFL